MGIKETSRRFRKVKKDAGARLGEKRFKQAAAELCQAHARFGLPAEGVEFHI